jgi:hypothetical protein
MIMGKGLVELLLACIAFYVASQEIDLIMKVLIVVAGVVTLTGGIVSVIKHES